MSTFGDIFGDDPATTIKALHGETVTHTVDSSGTTQSLTAIPGSSFAQGVRRRKDWRVLVADINTTPVPGDTITDPDDVDWEVEVVPESGTASVWLTLETSRPAEGL